MSIKLALTNDLDKLSFNACELFENFTGGAVKKGQRLNPVQAIVAIKSIDFGVDVESDAWKFGFDEVVFQLGQHLDAPVAVRLHIEADR
jgi:hypothetical protein